MLVKSVVIIHVIDPQYTPVTGVVNINYGYYSYKVRNRRGNALFLLFFHLPLSLLFLLNLFLKLR